MQCRKTIAFNGQTWFRSRNMYFRSAEGPGVCRHCSRPLIFHGQSHYRLAHFNDEPILTHGAVKTANCFFFSLLSPKTKKKNLKRKHFQINTQFLLHFGNELKQLSGAGAWTGNDMARFSGGRLLKRASN